MKISNVAPIIAALCLILAAWRWPACGSGTFKRIEQRLQALARRRVLTAVLLFAFPILARLALLPAAGVPIPFVHDEFGYLLVADTMLHGRLANPPHAYPEFFEALYIIQAPTYSSYYPVGIGVTLAVGRVLFGNPWGGFCSSRDSCARLFIGCCSGGLLQGGRCSEDFLPRST